MWLSRQSLSPQKQSLSVFATEGEQQEKKCVENKRWRAWSKTQKLLGQRGRSSLARFGTRISIIRFGIHISIILFTFA